MKRLLFILSVFFLLFTSGVWAEKSESVVVVKLNAFTDTLIEKINAETRSPVIGVADFVNQNRAAEERQVGSAVADIINQRLTNSGRFLVVESRQIDRVIESLNMGLTGLYDEKTAASIGHLIGAEYLVLGSVTKLAGFYRVNVRMVEVETGATIVNESLELDSVLIDKESLKYMPPKYRIRIGTAGVYDKLMRGGIECIGMTLGFSYEYRPRHSILLHSTYYFWGGWIDHEGGAPDYYDTSTIYLNELEAAVGYGYSIPVTRNLTAELSLSVGLLRIPWDVDTYYEDQMTPKKTTDTGVYTDLFIYPSVSFSLSGDNPISVFLSAGYRYAFLADEVSVPSAKPSTDYVLPELPFNDFSMKAGLQLYF